MAQAVSRVSRCWALATLSWHTSHTVHICIHRVAEAPLAPGVRPGLRQRCESDAPSHARQECQDVPRLFLGSLDLGERAGTCLDHTQVSTSLKSRKYERETAKGSTNDDEEGQLDDGVEGALDASADVIVRPVDFLAKPALAMVFRFIRSSSDCCPKIVHTILLPIELHTHRLTRVHLAGRLCK